MITDNNKLNNEMEEKNKYFINIINEKKIIINNLEDDLKIKEYDSKVISLKESLKIKQEYIEKIELE